MADQLGQVGHLATSELPEQATPNGDERIRDWTARRTPAELRAVPVPDKIRMINRLLDGWVSDDGLDAVDRLCANSSEGDMGQIDLVITPRVGSLTSLRQRSRLRCILMRRS